MYRVRPCKVYFLRRGHLSIAGSDFADLTAPMLPSFYLSTYPQIAINDKHGASAVLTFNVPEWKTLSLSVWIRVITQAARIPRAGDG
jgi:hypothetical protein